MITKKVKHVDGVTTVNAKGFINDKNEFVGEYKHDKMTYGITIPISDSKVALNKLINFCLEQTQKGNHFFLNYAGHVDSISVFGYDGEWQQHKQTIEHFNCSMKDLTEAKVERWIETFEHELS